MNDWNVLIPEGIWPGIPGKSSRNSRNSGSFLNSVDLLFKLRFRLTWRLMKAQILSFTMQQQASKSAFLFKSYEKKYREEISDHEMSRICVHECEHLSVQVFAFKQGFLWKDWTMWSPLQYLIEFLLKNSLQHIESCVCRCGQRQSRRTKAAPTG